MLYHKLEETTESDSPSLFLSHTFPLQMLATFNKLDEASEGTDLLGQGNITAVLSAA